MTRPDKTVRLWDLTAEAPEASPIMLRGHEDGVSSVVISPDGRWLATKGKTLRLWELSMDSLIERARRCAGRELTPEERQRYLLD